MGEPAGIWLRVSKQSQDEENQHPECTRWCSTHDYDVAQTYTVHGKSAFRGSRKFDQIWAQVISDLHNGRIKVLVVWKQNRLDRKLQTFQMIEQVSAAGGRIEFVSQPHLNNLSEMGNRIALKVEEEIAHAESQGKSDNVILAHTARRASGSVVGGAPWGYEVLCTVCNAPTRRPGCNHHPKALVPTAEGRKYIPRIFQMAIDGDSRDTIAAWLTAQGAGNKLWHGASVGRRLISNPTYYGCRPNSGQLKTPALVRFSVWQKANAAISSRVAPGRGTSTYDKPLAAPVCGECYDRPRDGSLDGRSPMYRVFCGDGKWRRAYFRCTGHGPQRKGCGADMIPVEDLDDDVTEAMMEDPNPYLARVFIPGDDRSDEIGKLKQAAMNAYLRDDQAEFERRDSEAKELERKPGIVAHWEERFHCEMCGPMMDFTQCVVEGHHIKTRGEHFASLNIDEQREELRQNWVILAKKDGVTILPRNWP